MQQAYQLSGVGDAMARMFVQKKSLWAYQLGKAERKSYTSQNSGTEVAFTFIVKHNCFWIIVVISLLTMHLWLSISNFAWL
ncbi:hypothetical protein HMPREF2955_14270 [Prevotella sp. HMSC073D09]|nr:hypothetical protein HMPREF2955_14270 [Prevotella sp. HMSC073D09]